ncbi:hypothetical protein HYV86_00380 [Candidatus Woesearchaeota archaeon]|nr:hypothetical protein [Candidatus Woesearchaeota archaeon]
MAGPAFSQSLPTNQVMELRAQGLSDPLIMEELTKQGIPPDQVHMAINSLEMSNPAAEYGAPQGYPSQQPAGRYPSSMPSPPAARSSSSPEPTELYSRIEEITESLIDEKWDQLIGEVKKIIEWKERVEERQRAAENDLVRLKEDFKILHQGVLGKLDEYDTRMQDVGTELKAVGRVFKDVVPVFVDNVKELSSIKDQMRAVPKKI